MGARRTRSLDIWENNLSKIIVCGEALIDLVPREIGNESAYVAKPGGSPFNIAKAAALAGGESYFHGALSTDFFGEDLLSDMRAAGVRDELVRFSDKLTTLAFVKFSGLAPRYAFYNSDTPSVSFRPGIGEFELGDNPMLTVGSISLIDQPAADRIVEFSIAESKRTLLAFDPNVRPQMIRDRSAWDRIINRVLDAASVIKLSSEDLEYIAPDAQADSFASSMLSRGTELVLFTDGENGSTAFARSGYSVSNAPEVSVIDTVGAGDSFMGAALVWIAENGFSDRESLRGITSGKLAKLLEFAAHAASINCTREGCSPPTRAEIDLAINQAPS